MTNRNTTFLGSICLFILSFCMPAQASLEAARSAYMQGNYSLAHDEWQRQASMGNAEAQFNLGYLFENGQGMPRDLFAAAKWYELAARQNYPTAAGMLNAVRKKIRKENEKNLLQWLPKAEAGESASQLAVAKLLAGGKKTVHDEVEAMKWLLLALEDAENGTTHKRMLRFKEQLETRLNEEQRQDATNRVIAWKDLRKPIN